MTNRLLNALTKEADNSDDAGLKGRVGNAGSRLQTVIAPFVENSRAVASSPADSGLMTGLITSVGVEDHCAEIVFICFTNTK